MESVESLGTDKGWVHPRDVVKAFATLGELSKDSKRTDLVGEFIGLLTGPSADRLFRKVWHDPVGHSILQEGRDLRATLADRTYLSSLPAGSLGLAYFDWTSTRDFTADGLAEVISNQVGRETKDPRSTMSARVVDMHDLWHVLNGWDSDIFGEMHLLGYSYAQLGGWAWLILALIANAILATLGRFEGLGYLRNSVRRGRKATLLVAVDWEAMLPLPLEEVRRQLSISDPDHYRKLPDEEVDALRKRSRFHRRRLDSNDPPPA
ncbi:MAG: ubiquinone biosynthesis protein COQ4 [Bacteroidia bacterium]